ncbi:MAG: spore coat U domain-containing protein [Gammaproteobacteria bacterium]
MIKSIRFKAFGIAALGAAVAIPLALVATPAQASTATTTFNVTATVTSNCNVTATNLAFGSYNVLDTAVLNGTSTVAVNCTKDTPFTVALDAGGNAGGATNFSARAMSNGATTPSLLDYQLYTNSAGSTVWGNGTQSSSTMSGTGTGPGSPVNETVYGQIPAGQNVPAGSYTDTVNVTVSY